MSSHWCKITAQMLYTSLRYCVNTEGTLFSFVPEFGFRHSVTLLIIYCLADNQYKNYLYKFTHVSHRGNSVVDYVLTPYEQLIRIKEFSITYMSDLINALQMQGNSKIPDHSVLIWSLSVTSNRIHKHHVNESQSAGKPSYNTSRNYESFLSDIEVRTRVNATIDKIISTLRNQSNVNEVYTAFTSLIFDEVSQHFPRRGNFNGNKNAKSFY